MQEANGTMGFIPQRENILKLPHTYIYIYTHTCVWNVCVQGKSHTMFPFKKPVNNNDHISSFISVSLYFA